MSQYRTLLTLPLPDQQGLLAEANQLLAGLTAEQRVAWALENLPERAIVSSSFGIQAALMLHLVTRQAPDISVVLVDTGYLFPETYGFVDQLAEQLQLNLHVYRASLSPAWQESRYGRLWEDGEAGIKRFNHINKVEPMRQALKELNVGTWFSGVRRQQSQSRAEKPVLEFSHGAVKVFPVIEWSSKAVHDYLTQYQLPYHPLWEKGYLSVGDVPTTRKWEPGMSEEETRFFGVVRECGLHDAGYIDGGGI